MTAESTPSCPRAGSWVPSSACMGMGDVAHCGRACIATTLPRCAAAGSDSTVIAPQAASSWRRPSGEGPVENRQDTLGIILCRTLHARMRPHTTVRTPTHADTHVRTLLSRQIQALKTLARRYLQKHGSGDLDLSMFLMLDGQYLQEDVGIWYTIVTAIHGAKA